MQCPSTSLGKHWDSRENKTFPFKKKLSVLYLLECGLKPGNFFGFVLVNYLADVTVSKRPGTSYRIEIHFAVFNRLYLLFSFIKLVETW